MQRLRLYIFWILLSYFTIEAYRAFVYYGIKKNSSGIFQKLNEIFEGENNYDWLILGSSRAESHISPLVLDSSLKTNSFNLGIAGSYIHQQLAFLKAYLVKHPKPKTILLSADIYDYQQETDYQLLHDYNRYFPYLNHDVFYSEMKKIDPRFFFYKYIAPYSLSFDKNDENLNHALRGYFAYKTQTLAYNKGFAFSPFNTDHLKLNTNSIQNYRCKVPKIIWEAYKELNELCKSQNMEIIIVLSPIHKSLYQKIDNIELISDSLKQLFENRLFLNFSQTNYTDRNDLFIDPVHLNKTGALLFSKEISHTLQQFLDEKSVR